MIGMKAPRVLECVRVVLRATRFVVSSMAEGDRESKQGGANRPTVVASRATELLPSSGRENVFRTLRMRVFGYLVRCGESLKL